MFSLHFLLISTKQGWKSQQLHKTVKLLLSFDILYYHEKSLWNFMYKIFSSSLVCQFKVIFLSKFSREFIEVLPDFLDDSVVNLKKGGLLKASPCSNPNTARLFWTTFRIFIKIYYEMFTFFIAEFYIILKSFSENFSKSNFLGS